MPNPTATFLASMMEGHFEASKAARLAMSSAAAPAAPRFGAVTNPANKRGDDDWSGGSSLPDEANDENHAARGRSSSRDRKEKRGESGDQVVSDGTGTLGSFSASSASSSSSPSGRHRDGVR